MIGGFDIELPGAVDTYDGDRLLRLIRAGWPGAWVEFDDGPEGEVVDLSAAIRRSVPPPPEMFIYRSEADAASWTAHGRTDENADRMIAVMMTGDSIAFVVDGPESESGRLVRSTIAALAQHRRQP